VALRLLSVLSASGCVSPSSDLGAIEQPIVGGAPAAECSWPSAVLAAGCSGVLVHPRVVVTAAHCIPEGITRVDFGESLSRLAGSVPVSGCIAHPSYDGNTDDIGFCLLAEDVNDVPVVPLMAPCEASALSAGAQVIEVGFGQDEAVTGPDDGFGTKRWIAGVIVSVADGRGQIDVTTGTQDGEYYGDSGGPLFFQMADGTWRVIGVDSSSPDIIPRSSAARVSAYTSVPTHMAWLETTSTIDLTVCHDATGWNPSAACAGFPLNPAASVGAWETLCSGQTLVTPLPTCSSMDRGAEAADASVSDEGAADAAGEAAGSDTGPVGRTGGASGASSADEPDRGLGRGGAPAQSGTDEDALGTAAVSPPSPTGTAPDMHSPIRTHTSGGCSVTSSMRETGWGMAWLTLCLGLSRRRSRP
jgi:hypothetical protein